MIDTYENREDCNIVASVAVPTELAGEFAAEVEGLAVEKYGRAAFAALLEYDEDDESMEAATRKSFAEQIEQVLATAGRIITNGR